MAQKIHITPGGMTALQAKVGIVVFTLFLAFGIIFGFVVLNETSGPETGEFIMIGMFFLIWVIVCISSIVVFAQLLSGKNIRINGPG
jgi:hypothetical protein